MKREGKLVRCDNCDKWVFLEKLEDKLVPKPAYMSYLSENAPRLEKCEICGKTTDVFNAKIVDNMGTRYRKVCRDCFQKNHFEPAE